MLSCERLLQENLKLFDQSLHKIGQLTERWDQRWFIFPFVEKDRAKRRILILEPVVTRESVTLAQDAVDPDADQSTMFVNVVCLMEPPKRCIPAFVGLQAVDEIDRSWFNDSVYFSTSQGFIFLERFANRERNLCQNLVANAGIGDQSEMIDKVVKRASQVMKNIADNSQQIKVNRGESDEMRRTLSETKLFLWRSDVKVRIPVLLSKSCEFTEMLFSPLDLYPDSDESFFGRK